MKKSLVWVLALTMILGLVALTGCGGGGSDTGSTGDTGTEYTAENPLVIRIGFLNAPTDSSVKSGEQWAQMLSEKSDGRIEVQVFASGELGSAREEYQALRDGTIEAASLIPGTIAGFDPRYELTSLPGLFVDEETAVQFDRNGFLGQEMEKYFEENGLIRLVPGEPNFYYFFTTDKAGAIGSMDEMKGKKMRIPESPMLKEFFEDAGSIPTPMAWGEIYTSLQRNVIDGTVGNLVWSIAAKFHEVATNIDMVNVQYTPSDWLFSKKAWDKIPADLQQIILDSVPEIQAIAAENWNTEVENNKKMLEEQGVKLIEPTEQQQKEWQQACFAIWKDYAVQVWGQDMVDQLDQEIINAQ